MAENKDEKTLTTTSSLSNLSQDLMSIKEGVDPEVSASFKGKEADLFATFKMKVFKDIPENLKTEFTQKERIWLDDRCLRRYMRAREWNVEAALKQLTSTIIWRREFKPDEITREEVQEQLKAHSNYLLEGVYDKENHPVLVMRARHDPPGSLESKLRMCVFSMEEAIRKMDKGVEQWVYLIWLKGFSLSKIDRETSLKFTNILQDHYPERLFRSFVVDAPMVFQGFFQILTPLMTEQTKSKIKFIKGSFDEKRPYFSEYFDMTKVESTFGGDILDDDTKAKQDKKKKKEKKEKEKDKKEDKK